MLRRVRVKGSKSLWYARSYTSVSEGCVITTRSISIVITAPGLLRDCVILSQPSRQRRRATNILSLIRSTGGAHPSICDYGRVVPSYAGNFRSQTSASLLRALLDHPKGIFHQERFG